MLKTEQALVLRTTPYGDKRVIINVYAPTVGRLGLIASLSKKSTKGLKPAHFQALQALELVYQENSKGELKALREARILYPYQQVYFDPVKSCLSLFMAEFLQKVLNDEEGNPSMFQFILDAIRDLDKAEKGLSNFHLVFLMRLTSYLGIQPHLEGVGAYLDLLQGELALETPHHPYFVAGEELDLWKALQNLEWQQWQEFSFKGNTLRRQALDNMIHYFRLQLHDFGPLKSMTVLREILA